MADATGIGDRMKGQYEDRARYLLPRRTYTVVRVDGKAFHTLTHGCDCPFDARFMSAMREVAVALCREAQGAVLAYAQSDEVSVLLQDFADVKTDAWFDGNVQKVASISASVATHAFSTAWGERGLFDARCFTIPDPVEVCNYFVWRQQDAARNSVQMAARAYYSHGALVGKNTKDMHEMLHAKGVNWNDYPDACKRGTVVRRARDETPEELVAASSCVAWGDRADANAEPRGWVVEAPSIFTQDREYLRALVPWRDGRPDAVSTPS